MNLTTATKPVMDVAAPKSQVPAHNPFPQTVTTPVPTRTAELPIRPAPFAPATAQPATPVATAIANAHRPGAKKAVPNALPKHHAPVALITVTVFVMLVLSALAVTVYMTSQTA